MTIKDKSAARAKAKAVAEDAWNKAGAAACAALVAAKTYTTKVSSAARAKAKIKALRFLVEAEAAAKYAFAKTAAVDRLKAKMRKNRKSHPRVKHPDLKRHKTI